MKRIRKKDESESEVEGGFRQSIAGIGILISEVIMMADTKSKEVVIIVMH